MRFSVLLVGCLSCSLAFAQEDDSKSFVNAKDFRESIETKLGRAKNNNAIEFQYAPSNYFGVTAYSVSYSRVVRDGVGEVIFPFTFNQFTDADQMIQVNNQSIAGAKDLKYKVAGFGLKYRAFSRQIEEGFYYGGGLKVYHFIWDFEKYNLATSDYNHKSFQFQAFSPLFELGYLFSMSKNAQFVLGVEGGGVLNTFDRNEAGKTTNKFSKPGAENNVYGSGNVGIRFGF
jgi:hypothetical protein